MSTNRLLVIGSTILILVTGRVAGGETDTSLRDLLQQKTEAQAQIAAVRKAYEPKLKPLQAQVAALSKEIREKSAVHDKKLRELKNDIEKEFAKLLPAGPQSYGDFTWSCSSGSWINVTAKDKAGKRMLWIQVFYRPDMTEEEQKNYGSKQCCGLPAKRFKNKWVWVQAGRIEMRFGTSSPTVQNDATLDAIVKSFNLDAIKKL